jgi:hypothetical protein
MPIHWRDCIITLIDLVGIRSQATAAIASTQMRKQHRTLLDQVQSDRYSFAHAYAYNDAVHLLAYVDRKAHSAEAAIRGAEGQKK